MAFQRGEQNEKATAGAILLADGLHSLRMLRAFVEGLGKAKKGGGRHG